MSEHLDDFQVPVRRQLDARRLRTAATTVQLHVVRQTDAETNTETQQETQQDAQQDAQTENATPMVSVRGCGSVGRSRAQTGAYAKLNETERGKNKKDKNNDKKTPMEIVFSEGSRPGQEFRALDVLGAPPTLQALPFDWPDTTSAQCLHCGEPIVGRPFFAIVQRLRTRQLETAHGVFCNRGPAYCNLAWLEDEFAGAERSTAIALTRDAMRTFLGVHEPFDRAPPRVALAKFSHTGHGISVHQFHTLVSSSTFDAASSASDASDASGLSAENAERKNTGVAYSTLRAPLVTFAAVLEAQRRQQGNEAKPVGGMSITQTRGLTRPRVRSDPVADNRQTGKPPAILVFIASQVGAQLAAQAQEQTQARAQAQAHALATDAENEKESGDKGENRENERNERKHKQRQKDAAAKVPKPRKKRRVAFDSGDSGATFNNAENCTKNTENAEGTESAEHTDNAQGSAFPQLSSLPPVPPSDGSLDLSLDSSLSVSLNSSASAPALDPAHGPAPEPAPPPIPIPIGTSSQSSALASSASAVSDSAIPSAPAPTVKKRKEPRSLTQFLQPATKN